MYIIYFLLIKYFYFSEKQTGLKRFLKNNGFKTFSKLTKIYFNVSKAIL